MLTWKQENNYNEKLAKIPPPPQIEGIILTAIKIVEVEKNETHRVQVLNQEQWKVANTYLMSSAVGKHQEVFLKKPFKTDCLQIKVQT